MADVEVARTDNDSQLKTNTNTVCPQIDSCSCGVLALTMAEVVVTDTPLMVINPTHLYYLYAGY